jgi:methylenetetrahydrofolate dehydrogenase (NADP+)/methenyltetrahydrofolate cyclohydrolase
MPLILQGKTAASAISAAAAERAAQFSERSGRKPTLAAVACVPTDGSQLYFDVKERAFANANSTFVAHVLPSDTGTRGLIECIRDLNDDDEVDGIFVQYPLPPSIDAQAAYDAIDPAKDVDGAGTPRDGTWLFMPATAEAVIQLLSAHDIGMDGCDVCIVRGDPLFAEALATLFRRFGARPTISAVDDSPTPGCIHTADIVVAATGVVNGVSAASFRNDAVAIDVGYYHGGGRGDIAAHPDDVARLRAFGTPRGAIGPLTVAILIEQTVTAAEMHATRRRGDTRA